MSRRNLLDFEPEVIEAPNSYPSMEDDLINESLRLKQLSKTPLQSTTLFSLNLCAIEDKQNEKENVLLHIGLDQVSILSLNADISAIDNEYSFFDHYKDKPPKSLNLLQKGRTKEAKHGAEFNMLKRSSFKKILRKQQQRVCYMRRLFMLLNKLKGIVPVTGCCNY